MSLLHYPFLYEMANVLERGIKGNRQENDWTKPIDDNHEWTATKYYDAAMRHLFKAYDTATVSHYAAAAVNCMIAAYHTKVALRKAKRELEIEETGTYTPE